MTTLPRRCNCCRELGRNRWYCNHCRLIFCDAGWNRQLAHTQRVDAVHEKTPIELFDMLRDCLKPNWTEAQLRQFHLEDEETTWFGVVEDEAEKKILQDYGRFGELMKLLSRNRPNEIFPAVVSFVGNTGTGKSTLIKILIKLHARPGFVVETPVVGSLEACNRPASVDVHVFADPKSAGQDRPIVYADSEGLEAGEIEPTAVREYLPQGANRAGVQPYLPRQRQRLRNAHYGSERPVDWATTAEKRSRRFMVTNVYPRVLYTFSDVVVFVIKNGREFENAAVHLLSWAERAIERSSNQPVLPHAIIAMNEAALGLSRHHWDVGDATMRLFRDYQAIVFGNPKLDFYVQDCRSRGGRVETLEDLLLMYYSSIRVVKIPEGGRPNLMEQQMKKLYAEIDRACQKSHETKRGLRMLFTATELNLCLQSALDHFAKTLDEPFDFIRNMSITRPIPQDFGGSITNLAIKSIKRIEAEDREISAIDIFQELSYIVASCIMLDIARRGKRGPSQKIFSEYVTHCDDALERFCDRGWPCEFKKDGHRCVNVRTCHPSSVGHQRRNGIRMETGGYQSSFTASGFRQNFRDRIFIIFEQSMDELNRDGNDRAHEGHVAANIHMKVLRQFFNHVGGAKDFKSNFSCFVCLMETPEHPLSCGHVICTLCVRSYGQERAKGVFELRTCPLEMDASFRTAQIVIKPRSCGVRVLALDGGGVRAIAQLEVLHALRREIGVRIPVRAFFDLIVGTDMGGLLALDLASENGRSSNWSAEFKSFCQRVFDRPRLHSIASIFYPVLYRTTPLETQLRERFGSDPLFGWPPQDTTPRTKLAVLSSSADGKSIVIANYNRPCAYKAPYLFDRPEHPRHELKVWEVARAITAVPTVFKSFTQHRTHKTYYGGSQEQINPVVIADKERKAIWPDLCDVVPDIIVSIGTGMAKRSKVNPLIRSRWFPQTTARDPEHCTQLAEKSWKDFRHSALHDTFDEPRYVRINVELDDPVPKFDDTARMRSLQDQVRVQNKSIDYKSLSQQLIASCFYFEVTEQAEQPSVLPDDTFKFSGSFYCRLSGPDLRYLGDYFRKKSSFSYPHHFVVAERGSIDKPVEIYLDGDVISRMIEQRGFDITVPEISVSQKSAIVDIEMEFDNGKSFPISGFPRPLKRDDIEGMDVTLLTELVKANARAEANVISATLSSPCSRESPPPSSSEGSENSATREEWKGPTLLAPDSLRYSLSEYRAANYVLGREIGAPSNTIELPTPADYQGRSRNVGLEGRRRSSVNIPELPTAGMRSATAVELPGPSLRSVNERSQRRSTSRYAEGGDRSVSPRPAAPVELPGSVPARRRRNRASDPTSRSSGSTNSRTHSSVGENSRSTRRRSSSRRHSDQPTRPPIVTSRGLQPESRQRDETMSGALPSRESRRRERSNERRWK